MTPIEYAPRSLLYVPGSNARALEKAQGLAADMLIIDLEDAVPADRKDAAREAMRAAVSAGFPGKRVAVRVNGTGSAEQAADIAALAGLALDAVVLPKVDAPADLDPLRALGLPVFAMIETPVAIYAARDIAADRNVRGLIAGLNDLAHELRLPDGMDRGAMSHAIQAIVLAARAGGCWCFDGVYNAIDDAAGFVAEAEEGRRLGFDGKTLIHPSQVDPCNMAFAPSPREIAAAEALVAAATGGAQRHDGRMVEDMHVAAARALLERAGR
ncbi:HpcH/HpaI aldolase/citrate lyase family protein [Sphingopyxis macrogoltabida]|uniref:Citryl-CoA lyase n=1 Tax=Sphingopyxis macrogoltabida TaxID=33050 RepID=A0A0N7GRW9_SPHMC|nr:CoA ester lyase [Sphingopyxis macrogoltabida]ALH79083.1 citryl-CoA lyase [Sphingopyxis macrogoltabida]